jgi:hypothetical protein
MEGTSYTAEKALAEALARLEQVEVDNEHLRSKLMKMSRDVKAVERVERRMEEGVGGREASRELEKVQKQNKEVSGGAWYCILFFSLCVRTSTAVLVVTSHCGTYFALLLLQLIV